MDGIRIALVTLAALLGCSFLGVFLHPLVPERHRGVRTHGVVRLGVGMVVTVTSLVLSLLTYSVKSNFDETETNARSYAASLIILDRSLRAYGPEANAARAGLTAYTEQALHSTWPEEFGGSRQDITIEDPNLGDAMTRVHDMIRRFDPQDAYHRLVAAECQENIRDVVRRRFTLVEQIRRSIPPLLLGGVIVWLAVIFLSFGLNAPRNPVVLVTLTLCALAISSSIYLIDEMDTPLSGVIKISSESMRQALAHQQG